MSSLRERVCVSGKPVMLKLQHRASYLALEPNPVKHHVRCPLGPCRNGQPAPPVPRASFNRGQLVGIHRSLKRRHLIYYLRVFDRSSGELVGHLVDVTTRGMMLISEAPLPNEGEFALRMDLPPGLFETDSWAVSARSLWSRPDINPAFWDTGFQFSGFTRDDELVVSDLVKYYGLND
jgi:hypothetical protein